MNGCLGSGENGLQGTHRTCGGVTVPCILTFAESYGAVYSLSVHIVTCKLSFSAFNMEKNWGESRRAFTLLILYTFTLFEV